MLNISHIEKNNYVNGNGCRYVIWVQGCKFKCPLCWNKYTWNTKPKKLKNIDEIFNDIRNTSNIDGITFSGGEPLLQAKELYKLASMIRKETNLGIHIFTGYEQYEKKSNSQKKLLSLADTIVFGRFDTSKPNNNQVVVNQSQNKWIYNNTDIEIDIDENLNILMTGYPQNKFIEKITEEL